MTPDILAEARDVERRYLGAMMVRDEVTGDARPLRMWEGWLLLRLGEWRRNAEDTHGDGG